MRKGDRRPETGEPKAGKPETEQVSGRKDELMKIKVWNKILARSN